jgi:hypothetical protein
MCNASWSVAGAIPGSNRKSMPARICRGKLTIWGNYFKHEAYIQPALM